MEREKRYRVVCEWVDAMDNDHTDSDEIQVRATSAASAIAAARKKWRLTIGAEWPRCRLEKTWILAPSHAEGLA
jgi:hypothetical protein